MYQETFQIPAFVTIILALTSLIVIPVVAMAASKDPVAVLVKSSDAPGGVACDLPPTVEIEGKGSKFPDSELPSMDSKTAGDVKTATFAMG